MQKQKWASIAFCNKEAIVNSLHANFTVKSIFKIKTKTNNKPEETSRRLGVGCRR